MSNLDLLLIQYDRVNQVSQAGRERAMANIRRDVPGIRDAVPMHSTLLLFESR